MTDTHQKHTPGTGDTIVKKIELKFYMVLGKARCLGRGPSSAPYQLCGLGASNLTTLSPSFIF